MFSGLRARVNVTMDSGTDSEWSDFSDVGTIDDIVVSNDFSDVEVSSVHTSDLSSDGSDNDRDMDDDQADPGQAARNGFTHVLSDVDILPFGEYVGVRHNLEINNATELDYFSLLLVPEAIENIVTQTNPYHQQCVQANGRADPKWTDVTVAGMRAYFGLTILMGIHKLPSLDHYWSSHPLLGNYLN